MTRPTPLKAWRVGQMLEGRVVGRADPGHVWLEIDGVAGRAQAPGDLAAGTALRARVDSLGARIVLEIVEQHAGVERVRGAMRGLLPRQSGFAPLLANVSFLAASADHSASPWPKALTDAARRLLESLPLAARLGFADALADALENSGLFLEARLSAAVHAGRRPPIEYDFKAALLRFAEAVRAREAGGAGSAAENPAPSRADHPPLNNAPLLAQPRTAAALAAPGAAAGTLAGIRREINGALHRLALLQLGAHPANNPAPGALFELPLRQGNGVDVWQLRIEHQPREGAASTGETRFTATLSFSLGELGPLQARLMVEGSKVSTLFWAEKAETADRYSAALDELAALYEANGLNVGALACHVGEPHASAPPASSLLDVRT